MIVGVVRDFEMTFTGELFKVVCENNDFVFMFQFLKKLKKKKKRGGGAKLCLSKIQMSGPGSSWPSSGLKVCLSDHI